MSCVGSQPYRFMQGCPAAHHRIQDDFAFQAAAVVIAGWLLGQMFEKEAEGRTAAPRPPFMQIAIRPGQMLIMRLALNQGVRQLHVETAFNSGHSMSHFGGCPWTTITKLSWSSCLCGFSERSLFLFNPDGRCLSRPRRVVRGQPHANSLVWTSRQRKRLSTDNFLLLS
jgi:hypothetical protein